MSVFGITSTPNVVTPWNVAPTTTAPRLAAFPSGNAGLGAQLIGEPVSSPNRFVRAFKAAIHELGFGSGGGAVQTLPQHALAPSPARAHHAPRRARRARKARRHARAATHRATLHKDPSAMPSRVPPVLVNAQGLNRPGVTGQPTAGIPGGFPTGVQPGGINGIGTRPFYPGMMGSPITPYGMQGMNGMMGIGGMMNQPAASAPIGTSSGMLSSSAPQLNASNQSGVSNSPQTLQQHVTNDNTYSSDGLSAEELPFGLGQGGFGYGSPYGGSVLGWSNPYGYGPASPTTAPGASMMGAYYTSPTAQQGGIRGFFSRLFGG